MLSKKATKTLEAMVEAEAREDHDEAELVREKRTCWLGYERVSGKIVDELLMHVAVRSVSEPGSIERYVVSGTGREILKDPEVADRIVRALRSGIAVDARGLPLDAEPS